MGGRCLLAPTADMGIPVGDACLVGGVCYAPAGTRVTVREPGGETRLVKAADLSGASNVLYRRNSVTGAVEAVARSGRGIALNEALHAND